jgi:hypothetical protein
MITPAHLIALALTLLTASCGHQGASSTPTNTISPPTRPHNQAPAAADATIQLTGLGLYEGTLPGVDPDGDPVTFELIRATGPVDLIDPSSGTFTYTQLADVRSGSIVYRIRDDRGLDDLATLTVRASIATTYRR